MSAATIRARLAAATPGQWYGASVPSGRKYGVIGVMDPKAPNGRSRPLAVLSGIPCKQRHPDTQLIAHAPTDLAALLAVAEAANWLTGCDAPGDDETPCGSCKPCLLGAALDVLEKLP